MTTIRLQIDMKMGKNRNTRFIIIEKINTLQCCHTSKTAYAILIKKNVDLVSL